MLILGPDGTTVLLDVGNDDHADMVTEAVSRYRGRDPVDAVILTHFHSDHAGGLDDLGVSYKSLVSRGPVHMDAVDLPQSFAAASRTDLCTETACTLPWTLELGAGAELKILAADGEIAGERFGELPDDDDGENVRSLVGTVSWGDFVYLWNGDLTGGGKDTPDLESFYAARLDLPSGGATVVHLGHHGINSSTYEAWVDRALPDDGRARLGLTGSNGSYLDAPADEVLERLGDRVQRVWTNRGGALTGQDPILQEAEDDVILTVTEDGAVTISGGGHTEELR
jgi:competence protein ComEC